MKFKIRQPEEGEEEFLEFWLEEDEKEISLMCCRKGRKGSGVYILSITPKGMLRRETDLPDNLGLLIDEKGRIKFGL